MRNAPQLPLSCGSFGLQRFNAALKAICICRSDWVKFPRPFRAHRHPTLAAIRASTAALASIATTACLSSKCRATLCAPPQLPLSTAFACPLLPPGPPSACRLLAIDAPLGFTVASLSFSSNLASLSLSRILIYVQSGRGAG